jgi:hypothetical protein
MNKYYFLILSIGGDGWREQTVVSLEKIHICMRNKLPLNQRMKQIAKMAICAWCIRQYVLRLATLVQYRQQLLALLLSTREKKNTVNRSDISRQENILISNF